MTFYERRQRMAERLLAEAERLLDRSSEDGPVDPATLNAIAQATLAAADCADTGLAADAVGQMQAMYAEVAAKIEAMARDEGGGR